MLDADVHKQQNQVANQHLYYAQNYARLGWAVVPLHRQVEDGCSCPSGADCALMDRHVIDLPGDADTRMGSTNERTLERWWRLAPQASLAVLPARSQMVVVTLDAKVGGPEVGARWQQLCRWYGEQGRVVQAQTPDGSRYLYFHCPEPLKKADRERLGNVAGLGLRYQRPVPLPPAVTSRGQLSWVDVQSEYDLELPELPAWVLGACPAIEAPEISARNLFFGWIAKHGGERASQAMDPWNEQVAHLPPGMAHWALAEAWRHHMQRGERVRLPNALLKWDDVSKEAKVYWAIQALYHQVRLPAPAPEEVAVVLGVTRGRIYDYTTELVGADRWGSWYETEKEGFFLAPADLLTDRKLGATRASVRYMGLALVWCLSPYLQGRVGQAGILKAAGITPSALRDHQQKLAPILSVRVAPMNARAGKRVASNYFRLRPSERLGTWEFQHMLEVDRL